MTSQLLFVSSNPLRLRSVVAGPRRARSVCARRPTAPRACEVAPAVDTDAAFARLNHVNQNIRKMAAIEISQNAGDAEIARLLALLELEDTGHRRAAVVALGMIGEPVLRPLTAVLATSASQMERASSAKAIASVVLYYPELRESFPQDTLDGLSALLKAEGADPVTKLSIVGLLGMLGSDGISQDGDGVDVRYPGCPQALDMLTDICVSGGDMGTAANAIGAIAQIGQNGNQQVKEKVIATLRRLSTLEDPDPESGVEYVRQMAAGNITQLEGGPSMPEDSMED